MILHTVDSIRPDHGGPSRTVPRLVRALREAGCPAQLIVRDASGDGSLRGLLSALDENRDAATVLHDHGIWLPANHAIARWCRRNHIPRVVSLRGMLTPWAWQHRRWKKRLAWWLYQRRDLLTADAVHVTSDAEREDCLRRGIGGRIVCAANGVDLPDSDGLDVQPTEEGPRRAVCLARLHPVKGLEMLVTAWCRAARPDWRLTIAGPDADGYADSLRRLAAACGGDGGAATVEVRDEVQDDDKWQLLASAELFLLPSQSENFGMSIAEALACATPVIVTDRTPWREVQQLECGWVIPYSLGDLETAIAHATCCSQAELRQRGRIGRQLIQDRYAWPQVAAVLRGLYSQIERTVPVAQGREATVLT